MILAEDSRCVERVIICPTDLVCSTLEYDSRWRGCSIGTDSNKNSGIFPSTTALLILWSLLFAFGCNMFTLIPTCLDPNFIHSECSGWPYFVCVNIILKEIP